jgi:hypothetical protein
VSKATELAKAHTGWIIWETRPIATRARGNHRQPSRLDGTYAETLVGDNWDDLDGKLTEQDANDAARSDLAKSA